MSALDLMQFRVAYRMAMADGSLSSNEKSLLDLLQKAWNLSDEDAETLMQESERIDFDALPRLFPRKDQRMQLLEVACMMAMADGMAQPEEWELSVKICETLRVERPEALECVQQARRRLITLAREHDLMDELQENLKRQGII